MSRRDQITLTDEEVIAYLREQKTVICATNGVRGVPHLMPLWYVLRNTGPAGKRCLKLFQLLNGGGKVGVGDQDLDAGERCKGRGVHLLRGMMMECDVAIHRDVEVVEALGLEIFGRYAGTDEGEVAPEVREMVAKQASERIAMQFVERRRASWDHRRLGGVY